MTSILGSHAPKPDGCTPEQRVVAAGERALRKGKAPAAVLRVTVFANAGRLSPEVLERLFRELYIRRRPAEFSYFNAMAPEGSSEKSSCIISSTDLLARAVRRVPEVEVSQRWGLHVRAQAVTQFVGETSAAPATFHIGVIFNVVVAVERGRAARPEGAAAVHIFGGTGNVVVWSSGYAALTA